MLYDSIQLLEGSKLLNVVVDSGTSFPANPNSGEMFFYTTDSKLYLYNGTTWIDIGTGSIPAQTGNSGKYLTTNGSALSWASVEALPSQTNNSGKYLTTNGTAASWSTIPSGDATALSGIVPIASGGTGVSAVPGSNGQILYNNNSAFGALSTISYGTSGATQTLTLGSQEGTFNLRGKDATSTNYTGSNVSVIGGDGPGGGSSYFGSGGSVSLVAGRGLSSGGNINITAGGSGTTAGSIFLSTFANTAASATERLRIVPSGAWGLSGANYGTSGQVLTSNGSGAAPTWATPAAGDATALSGIVPLANGGTGLSAMPGSSGQLLFNSSGAYSAAARMSYNGSALLTVGSSDTTFTLKAAAASSIGFNACDLVIQAGSSANSVAVSGGRSGNTTIAGGDGDSGSGAGGDLIIRGGTGPVSSGTVYIRTGNSSTDRLQISPVGAWGLSGANYGTTGQVLTSNGSNSSPTWTSAGVGTVTSVGVSSSGTYSAALTIGSTPVTSSGTITITPNLFDSSTAGIVPASGGGTTNFLRADGTWAAGGGGASISATNTWTATQTFSGSTGNPSVAFGNAYTENQGAVTATSTTTIDCSVANNFTVTLAASITTLTFTNVPVTGRNYSVSLFLLQDATGGKTISWPNSVRWPGGSAPAITSTANKYDVISLVTFDGGTSWLGFVAGQNF